MTADSIEDAWLETCYIAIAKGLTGNDLELRGITESFNIEFGEKDIEGIPLVNGGRVMKWTPEGDSTVSFDALYPLEAGTSATAADSAIKGVFDLLHDTDTSVPIRVSNTRTRNRYRVLFLWTNDSAVNGANDATATNKSGLRVGLANGHFTSVKAEFSDGLLKFSMTYKTTAFDKSANSQIIVESAAGASGSDVLPAIGAYISTTAPFN